MIRTEGFERTAAIKRMGSMCHKTVSPGSLPKPSCFAHGMLAVTRLWQKEGLIQIQGIAVIPERQPRGATPESFEQGRQ